MEDKRENDYKLDIINKGIEEIKSMVSQLFDRQRETDIEQGKHSERIISISDDVKSVDKEQRKLFWWVLGCLFTGSVAIVTAIIKYGALCSHENQGRRSGFIVKMTHCVKMR